ncbi:TniQ family protein [Paenibacillus aurantius]|uniref:TniQ family protein n=1 Tax=Paenibacillus aurantius TaxID=2918900 RepID=A0AA96L9M4_9BACL|nr:TniQ family protein [Paenibacillus aurantius]WNQ09684.1 TniQ family protein [Paenibacillus aurantius]
MSKFLIRPRPEPDESISSFLIRVSQSNQIQPQFIYKLLSIYDDSSISSYFLDTIEISKKDLSLLENLVCYEEEILKKMFIFPFDKSGNEYIYFDANVNISSICTKKLKVCSYCLKENNYFRKIWSLINLTSCPVHSSMLIDDCQQCLKPITWWSPDIFRCSCGHEHKNSKLIAANEECLYLSEVIFEKCGTKTIDFLHKRSSVLDQMNFQSLNSSILFIAKFLGECRNISHFSSFNYNLEEFSSLQSKVIKVFSDWPNEFYKFLEKVKVTNSNKKYTNIMGDFGRFYIELFASRNDNLVILRKGFINYLLENFNSYSNPNFPNIVNMYEELVLTGSPAARYLKTSREKLIRLIDNHEIKGQISKKSTGTSIIVIKKSLEEYKTNKDKNDQQFLSYQEVQKYLNVGFGIDDIEKYGYIEYSYKDNYNSKYFEKHSIDKLINSLKSKVIYQVTDESSMINFQKVVNIGQANKLCSSGRLVEMIVNEELLPCAIGTGIGLNALMFNKMDVKDFFRQKIIEIQGEDLRTVEVARMFSVKEHCVNFWVKIGILEATNHGKFPFKVFNKMSIQRFQETYISKNGIKNEYLSNLKISIRKLEELGLKPITGYKIDGGFKYMYLVKDVKTLLNNVVN